MTLPRPLVLLSGVLLLTFSVSAALPPELTILRQQYEKSYTERVTSVHDAVVGELNAKFTAALNNAIDQAKAKGDLETVLAFQADKTLLAEKKNLPATDAENTPDTLKDLRAIYRQQIAKITEQHTSNVTALQEPYTARLQELEATLTKNDRIEEATTVREYRLSLPKELRLAEMAITKVPVVSAPDSNVPAPISQGSPQPMGDDRAAAEWVISIGGQVKVSGESKTIRTAADLPTGKFRVAEVTLPSDIAGVKVGDLDRLANLTELTTFRCSLTPQSNPAIDDDEFRFLGSCPKLTEVQLQNCSKLEGCWLAYLAPLKNLTMLILVSSASSDVSGLSLLGKNSLTHLSLRGTATSDESLLAIGQLGNLEFLGLRSTPVTNAGIEALSTLSNLEILDLTETAVTAAGLTPLARVPLRNIGLGSSAKEFAGFAPVIAKIFPRSDGVILPPGNLSASTLGAIGSAWPKMTFLSTASSTEFDDDTFDTIAESMPDLQKLMIWRSEVKDVHLAGIARLKKLKKLNLQGAQVTDAILPTLVSLKSLTNLVLLETQVSAKGLAEIMKQRPDIDYKPFY